MRDRLYLRHGWPSLGTAARFAPLIVSVTVVAGCALREPPEPPAVWTEGSTVVAPDKWVARGAAASGSVSDNWVATFRDDRLMAAVSEAIAYNSDLRQGAARVEQAQLHAKLAGAKLYPSVDLLAAATRRGGGSEDTTSVRGAIVAMTWEIDLWGRIRYGRAAAAADAVAVRADFEYARQSIAALVAKNWFLAIEAGLQADVARRAIRDGDELVRLAEARSRIGAGNDEDVFVARASAGAYRDTLRQLEFSREEAIRGLEILLGRYPAAAADVAMNLPGQPDAVPAGLPSELLERRPDLVAAERRVAAAFNRVHEAKAARLPAIALTSGARTGISSISSDLFLFSGPTGVMWNLGANLIMPVYKGGALRAQVEIRTAEQKESVAAYASIGARAYGEVENALAAETTAHEREQILAQTLADNLRALEVVQTRFKVGSTDLRFVTERQLALNATQSALVRVQAEQRVQRVNLHLALGGSFEPRPQP
jgi:NodT family efflux transporter outer membrane factor (OMF) lipoprotein